MAFSKGIKHLQKDKVLKKIIKKVGKCTLTPKKDYFESLLSSIMYQQLSLKAAGTIYGRFKKKVGRLTPANVLKLTGPQMRACGVSKQKQRYVKDLARHFRDKKLTLHKLAVWSDQEVIDHLTQVVGIGKWTAEMFLIFSLNRMDVFPMDDLGLQRGIMENFNMKKYPSKKRMEQVSKNWIPYRTLATWYLWKSLEGANSDWY